MKQGFHRIRFAGVAILLVFVTAAIAWAQPMLQLGHMSYGRAPARPLLRTVSRAPGFFLRVGGVAFEAVAVGDGGIRVVDLKYDSTRPDGSRLVIVVEKPGGRRETLAARIYDWELVPIARFAASDDGSAVTIFGELKDKIATEAITDVPGNRVINYHPAFDNTLMGLRLLQADLLIIQGNAADLFRDGGGQYLLGAGEGGHDLSANQRRYAAMHEWLTRATAQGHSF